MFNDKEKANERLIDIAWVAGFILILALHALWYYPFFSDDAFISLVYSQRLLDGQGLTWTDGSFVEGYSNLLWVLLTAGVGYFGLNLVAAARLVCFIASIGCLYVLYAYNRKQFPTTYIPAVCALMLFVTNGPTAAWSQGGLEATTHALLILLIAALTSQQKIKYLWMAGFALALASINRPEGILLLPFILAIVCIRSCGFSILNPKAFAQNAKKLMPSAIALGLAPLIVFSSQLAFRVYYYGDWVPNTFHAKFAITKERSIGAYEYLSNAFVANLPLGVLILIGVLVYAHRISSKETRSIYLKSLKRISPALSLVLAWLLIVYLGGGDIFPAYRHIVPIIPVIILIISDMIGTSLISRKTGKTEISTLILLTSILSLYIHITDKENIRAKTELYPWAGKQIAEVLYESWKDVSPAPLTAMTCAGAQAFYLKLPALDMHGLNDKNLTALKNPTFGKGCIGHELINLDYIFSRNPDAIISNVGLAMPEWEMIDYPGFQEQYQLVRLSKLPSSIGIEAGFQPFVFIRKDRTNDLLKPWMEALPWSFVTNKPPIPKNINDFRQRHLTAKNRDYELGLQTGAPFWFFNNHLLLLFNAVNQEEVLNFPAQAGMWDVTLTITKAPDYGIIELILNDGETLQVDSFSKKVETYRVRFNKATLKSSGNELRIRVVGKNSESTGYYAGIDYISWEPATE